MKSWILKVYDKLLIIVCTLLFIAQIFFIKEVGTAEGPSADLSQFSIVERSSQNYLAPEKVTSVLPGDILYYRKLGDTDWLSTEIPSVEILRRTNVSILTQKGENLEGTLASELILGKDWAQSVESISIKHKRDTIFVPLKSITKLSANQQILLPPSLQENDWSEIEISLYQRLNLNPDDSLNLSGRQKWVGSKTESNASKYDLFTPPIIYIDDGKLTARLPEKEKPQELQEPFGLKLISATKSPYFLRLVSWVGDVPYFEDTQVKLSEGSSRNTRNRLEVGKFYKRDPERKPGQPSLIECQQDDSEKLIKVEHFVVQQHKNTETGGLRLVGRSLVQDFLLGGAPFEINSIMREVFAGDYTFKFTLTLPLAASQDVEISSKDEGRIFSLSGRTFHVKQIDLKANRITLIKKDPRVLEDIEKTFSFLGQ
jgi:hypothetical protein